jgi:uncharacterized membrane protein
MQREAEDPVLHNVQAIAELERVALQRRSTGERVADAITNATGTFAFIALQIAWFTGWLWLNISGWYVFDKYPYNLLTLTVSLEAIILASFVLMTQNRMTRQADRRAHLDLQINLLAEQELTAILHMLHALCEQTGVSVTSHDVGVERLLEQTNVKRVAVAVEKQLDGK